MADFGIVEAIYMIVVIISAGFSVASAASGKSHSQKTADRRGIENTVDTQVSVPVVYGKRRVGINIVDMSLSGDDNTYLHIIGTICEGPINGVVQVGGVDQIYLDDKLWNTYTHVLWGPMVSYEIFTGTASQAVCSTYAGVKPGWDSALPYTAYIYISIMYDQDVFQNKPVITLEIEGLQVYDPDSETTAYSNNAALCARDYMTRSARRGGMGIASARIDDTTVTGAATYCTAKGWTCDLVMNDENKSAIDHLQDILSCFRGSVIYSGALFKMVYSDLNYETSVMDLTEDDVIEAGGRSSLTISQPSIFDTPNAVKMAYFNAENKWAQDEYVLSDEEAMEADGGDYREKIIAVPGITATANVMMMANYFLERLRINKTAGVLIGSRGMALEPHDLVTLTHSRPGWSSKLLRVAQPTISQSGEVALQLIEEDEDMYDDVYNLASHSWDDTNLPDPRAAVAPVINVTHEEELYNYRGRSFTRWKIDFDAPATANYPWWSHADIWTRIGLDGDWKYQSTAKTDFVLDPVEEGVEYYCCIVSVSIWGVKQPFGDGTVISRNILGKTSVPSNVAGFTALAHGDNVTLFADTLAESDIAGYEVRLGSAWNGGIFIGFNETPNFRLSGVRPSPAGTPHTFWIAALDNAGNYSETPASVQVTVFYPPGYTDKNTWAWDFDGIGTHDNTEHETYDSSDALKCSHTDNVLTGTWLSPEYDLGSAKTVRVWGDFICELEAAGGTWDALFPGTAIWSSKITSTIKWFELLSPAYAGILTAKLMWGTTSGALTESTDKLEILAPEIYARYVQVEITITDPDAASNLHLKTLNMKAAYWS